MKVKRIYKEDNYYCIEVENFIAKASSLQACKNVIIEELKSVIDEEISIMLEEYIDKEV